MFPISKAEAARMLEGAIERAGSLNAYAEQLGVSPQFISPMRSGKSDISGVVADDLCIKSVKSYEFTGPKSSPKQEQYEHERREWCIERGLPYERSKNMRVTK